MTTRVLCKPGPNWYYGYIYRTHNTLHDKYYVGKRKGRFHPAYFGSSTSLNEDICEYGIKYFEIEILQLAYSEDELNELEGEWIQKLNAVRDPSYYNCCGRTESYFRESSTKRSLIPKNELSKAAFGKNNYQSIPVIQLTLEGKFVKEWECLRHAHSSGYRRKMIKQVLNGEKDSYKGYKWVLAEEYYRR